MINLSHKNRPPPCFNLEQNQDRLMGCMLVTLVLWLLNRLNASQEAPRPVHARKVPRVLIGRPGPRLGLRGSRESVDDDEVRAPGILNAIRLELGKKKIL